MIENPKFAESQPPHNQNRMTNHDEEKMSFEADNCGTYEDKNNGQY